VGGRVAHLRAVADGAVHALRVLGAAARHPLVDAAARPRVGRGVAAVRRARGGVAAIGRGPGVALASGQVAGLHAVAELAVVAVVEVAAGMVRRVAAIGSTADTVVAVLIRIAAARDLGEGTAARARIAGVIGADVVVAADDVWRIRALPGREDAGFDAVAGIPVVALRVRRAAVDPPHMHARTERPVTIVDCVVAAVVRAHHAVVAALKRPGEAVAGVEVAGPDAVAELVIVAHLGFAGAAAVAAGVVQGAGIAVVARERVRRVDTAPARRVARIVGAEIVVVAVDRRARTLPIRAGIVGGAAVAVVARRPLRLLGVRGTGGARAGAALGHVAGARRRTAYRARRLEAVGGAVVGRPVARLGAVTHARRRPAHGRALGVGRAAGAGAGAVLGKIADARRGPALRRGGLEGIRRAVGARADAALRDVAEPRRATALHGARLEGVRGATIAHAIAALGHVAVAGRRAAHGRALGIRGAGGTRAGAGLGRVAGAGGGPAHR